MWMVAVVTRGQELGLLGMKADDHLVLSSARNGYLGPELLLRYPVNTWVAGNTRCSEKK